MVTYFRDLFSHQEGGFMDEDLIRQTITSLVNSDDNTFMCSIPIVEEVKSVVFELNVTSNLGSDGFFGYFFQRCWEVVE